MNKKATNKLEIGTIMAMVSAVALTIAFNISFLPVIEYPAVASKQYRPGWHLAYVPATQATPAPDPEMPTFDPLPEAVKVLEGAEISYVEFAGMPDVLAPFMNSGEFRAVFEECIGGSSPGGKFEYFGEYFVDVAFYIQVYNFDSKGAVGCDFMFVRSENEWVMKEKWDTQLSR